MLRGAGRLRIGPFPFWPTTVLGVALILAEPGLGARAVADRPDIYYIWRDGVRLAEGQNPYAYDHVPEPDERPTKHPSYLPLFYLAVAGVHRLGIHTYGTWLGVWRLLEIVMHAVIMVMLYAIGSRADPWLGVFGALFWGLNRWTLYVVRSGSLDELALLLLLLSLHCFGDRRRRALLLFGTSLAIKHVGLLVAPLYLVWTWQDTEDIPRATTRWMKLGQAAGWIALIPAAVSLPFLWWDAGAFTRSILSSVVRAAAGPLHVSAIGSLLGLRGGVARLPLVGLVALVVLIAAHRRMIGRYMAVLLIFAVFTDFNTVLFPQYFAWVTPFLVLACSERVAPAAGPDRWRMIASRRDDAWPPRRPVRSG